VRVILHVLHLMLNMKNEVWNVLTVKLMWSFQYLHIKKVKFP